MTYVDQVTSQDKSIKILEGYQHVMVKVCLRDVRAREAS
jgi:hypothetical protein